MKFSEIRTPFFALASLLLLFSVLPACSSSQTSICTETSALCDGQGPIVDANWLRDALNSQDHVQVIDVRPPNEFAAGHVPGSLSLDVEALRATVNNVSGQLAPPDVVEAAFRTAGLRLGARVVALANDVVPEPARVLWTLHYFDHPNAHLLQGGWMAWSSMNGEVEVGAAMAASGDFLVKPPNEMLRIDAAWILDHLQDSKVTLIDARSPDEYAAGHIPGALLVDWHDNVNAGYLRSREELVTQYAKVPLEGTAVVYCKSGMRASLTYVVLQTLGYADVRLYDGSWNEWGANAEFPKEK